MMGCALASTSVIPSMNHIPIERLYANGEYSLANAFAPPPPLPVVTITAPPTPVYVKSALKKIPSDSKQKADGFPLFSRRLPPINKAVNFDEQVLVKARTPTPSKVWYEKASSTMPMRKRPRNDDDDYDYDDEEEVFSDEEEDEEEENNEASTATVRPPTPLKRRNQPSSIWQQNDPAASIPSANINNEDDPFSKAPQSYVNGSAAANRIKVRRRLPDPGPPLIVPVPSYQPTLSPYQTSMPNAVFSPYQSSLRPAAPAFHVQRIVPPTSTTLPDIRPPLTNSQSVLQTAYHAANNRPPNGNIT